MINDTDRFTNDSCTYNCSIRDSTFMCCHSIDDSEGVVEITISITEKGSEGTEKGEKEEI